MASNVLPFILKLGIFGSSVVFLCYFTKSKIVRRLIFTYLTSKYGGKIIASSLDPHKKLLFSQLESISSKDPKLAIKGPGFVRILEIGIGSGSNLRYYPSECHLIALEPNKFFEDYFNSNKKEFDQVVLEKCVQESAEDMITIPTESIDVVVSTHVLCSVDDVTKCLKEIHRVLVPGGKFFFVEHTAFDHEEGWKRAFQKLSEPVWSFFSDGCQLSRTFDKDFASIGFSSFKYEKILVDGVFYVMKPHVIGFLMK